MAFSEGFDHSALMMRSDKENEEAPPRKKRKPDVDLSQELLENGPDDFKGLLGMSEEAFQHLLSLVSPKIARKDTVMRKSISAEQRLGATLSYLSTGKTLEVLKYSTGISAQALGQIIPETCQAIYDVLRKEFMKFPKTTEEWQKIADGFDVHYDFPNCGGALDGRHISIVPPPGDRSYYYNYNGYFSVILLAIVNADLEFIMVDVGKNGSLSNAEIIEEMLFCNKLVEKSLNLPENDGNKHGLNFVFIGNEAFDIHDNLLSPYPVDYLTYEGSIFNYRLSRAQRVVENAFGVLCSRFRIFQTSMGLKPEKIDRVVLASCVLHNYLRRNCRELYTPENFVDYEDKERACVIEGKWRQDNSDRFFVGLEEDQGSYVEDAEKTRLSYVNYFNGPGRVHWQDRMIF